ncbi:hypothetical protein M128_1174 [Bacteroides fragilis str. S6L8]|uniref:Uncharacterized protein n=6 Tax=Bacteroides fragilis TaxID=817 RepID=A0A016AMV1_BACFG|nr:hypothetical protein M101_1088 [Bacteroides fragilis str. 1007-1-F \
MCAIAIKFVLLYANKDKIIKYNFYLFALFFTKKALSLPLKMN